MTDDILLFSYSYGQGLSVANRNRGPGVAAATATVINLAGRGPAVPQEIRKNELRASRHKSVSCPPEYESGSSLGKKKIGELSEGVSSGWELAHPTLEPEDDTPPSLDGRTRGQLGGLAGDLPGALAFFTSTKKLKKISRFSVKSNF